MRKHHSKNKGDLGVLKATVALAEQGWLPLLPLSEHENFDLVGYKDGQFRRIQIKYRTLKNGVISTTFRSVWSDKNGIHTVPVDKSTIDLYCMYCPETDECYWFNPKDFNNNVNLRVKEPKNNQKLGINLASDYLKIP